MVANGYIIEFDEINHVYRVNGEVKQSVTQMLKEAGVCDYSSCPQFYADRGTAVHHFCTLLAQGWLSWEPADNEQYLAQFDGVTWEACLPYVKVFERLIFDLGLSYVSSEQAIYDPKYDICGTYDLIMMWQGKRTLVELKTGKVEQYHGLQIASYERMLDVDDVMAISLKDGAIFVKAPDWDNNHKVLDDIHTGWFDLQDWKKDRKRRRMIRYKETA